MRLRVLGVYPGSVAEVIGLRRSFWCGVKGQRYRLIWRDADGVEQASLLHRKRDLMDVAERREITVYRGETRTWWAGDVGSCAGITRH